MATHRFHIPAPDWDPEQLALRGDEARHCREVMRRGPGDRVVVFDGTGTEAEAEILSADKDSVKLKSLLVNRTAPPPARLTLGQAIPKGKNMDLIIQKATELGVSRIVPLLSERTVVQLAGEDLGKKRDKWQRVAVEACKQCGQNWIPEVAEPQSVEKFVDGEGDGFRVVAAIDDSARSLKAILAEWMENRENPPNAATVLIGPEGDFTPAEISRAVGAGFAPLTLGPIILRSETAAIHALSILAYELMG